MPTSPLPSFTWSDDCDDRGWLSFAVHPDTRPERVQEYGRDMWADERRCCGWYLLSSHPEGSAQPVMASSYATRLHPLLGTSHELRPAEPFRYFSSISEARVWLVEQATALALRWRWSSAGDLIAVE